MLDIGEGCLRQGGLRGERRQGCWCECCKTMKLLKVVDQNQWWWSDNIRWLYVAHWMRTNAYDTKRCKAAVLHRCGYDQLMGRVRKQAVFSVWSNMSLKMLWHALTNATIVFRWILVRETNRRTILLLELWSNDCKEGRNIIRQLLWKWATLMMISLLQVHFTMR